MENCYKLLEIAPTASTEEIEEAYQRKKKDFTGDAAKQQELDSAYNDAIMATFAPIRAFASPLPPLITGKNSQPDVQAAPVRVMPVQDMAVQTTPVQPAPVHQDIPVESAPVQAMPVESQAQIQIQPQRETPETEATSPLPPPVRPQTQGPTASLPFSDEQIMNMDVSEIKNYIPQNEDEDAGTPFLGIEDKLLRHYAKTYIAVVVFDMLMRFIFGPRWLVFTEVVSAEYMPTTPLILLIPLAFVSIAFCFICSLPVPFAARFFIIGHPPEKNSITWSLFFISIVAALLLHWMIGYFSTLYSITGSSASLIIVASAVSLKTLQYEGS